jgi:hypothetical protein
MCLSNRRGAGLGLGRAEIARIGDWANGLIDVGHPVEPCVSMRHWVGSRVGCGRWCGVCGAVVALPYPVVLTFPWLVYLITYLHVATGGFVLELPGLMHLILPVFELFALDYPVFAIFEPSVLVLGFPTCGSLNVVMWVTSCLVLALFGLPLPPCTHLSLLICSFWPPSPLFSPFPLFSAVSRPPLLPSSPHSLCYHAVLYCVVQLLSALSCGKKVITSRISGPDKYRRVVLVVHWGAYSPIVGS